MEGFNVRRSKGKEVPATELSIEQLQKAYKNAQRKQLKHHRNMMILDEILDKLEEEAESRGVSLEDIDSQFIENKKVLK